MKNYDKWSSVKRILAVIAAFCLWLASMQFSYSGFAVQTPEAKWLGWVLAISITVIELVLNAEVRQLNLTLMVAGVLAYIYGVYTNVIGFYLIQGRPLVSIFDHPEYWAFPFIVGLFLEIVPEPLFVWGIGASDKGDLIGNLWKSRDHLPEWTQEKPKSFYHVEHDHPTLHKKSPESSFATSKRFSRSIGDYHKDSDDSHPL